MKILTRYIFKEMLGPTALGFAFYTFIILMKNLFDFAGMIIKRSLPAATVFFMWATLHSAMQFWRGKGGTWKGRVQDPLA